MNVGVRNTQELINRPRAILSTANIAMPNNLLYKEYFYKYTLTNISAYNCLYTLITTRILSILLLAGNLVSNLIVGSLLICCLIKCSLIVCSRPLSRRRPPPNFCRPSKIRRKKYDKPTASRKCYAENSPENL